MSAKDWTLADYRRHVPRIIAERDAALAEVERLRGEHPDIYELRERGLRVLGDEQCCELACNGGACESCPCCAAGWCVWGTDDLPDQDTDAENYAIWLEEASAHNPVAKRLAEAGAERVAARDALARVEALCDTGVFDVREWGERGTPFSNGAARAFRRVRALAVPEPHTLRSGLTGTGLPDELPSDLAGSGATRKDNEG